MPSPTATPTQRHHIDKWARQLANYVADGDGDELLPTKLVADLLHIQPTTLEIWRSQSRKTKKRVGPPFVRVTPRMVRYRRNDLVKWLRSRAA